jgi:hypothetical protein
MSVINDVENISRVLGGQYWLQFNGQQSGSGLLSTDMRGAKTSFATLYQKQNEQTGDESL